MKLFRPSGNYFYFLYEVTFILMGTKNYKFNFRQFLLFWILLSQIVALLIWSSLYERPLRNVNIKPCSKEWTEWLSTRSPPRLGWSSPPEDCPMPRVWSRVENMESWGSISPKFYSRLFLYKSFMGSFLNLHFRFVIFLAREHWPKSRLYNVGDIDHCGQLNHHITCVTVEQAGQKLPIHKMLMKLAPVVNVINIKRAAFLPIFLCQKSTEPTFRYEISAHITLVWKSNSTNVGEIDTS